LLLTAFPVEGGSTEYDTVQMSERKRDVQERDARKVERKYTLRETHKTDRRDR
jgi:hypothetical protein